MGFGSKTNAPKDGLKIRVMELATGPSLFRDVFALNGDPRRQTPFSAKSSQNNDGPGARAMTQISSPNFLWKFLHQIRMF